MQIYFSLGTNLGDKERNLRTVVQKIEERIGKVLSLSSFYTTAPWGFSSENTFLNAALCAETPLLPLAVLEVTQGIEREMGRAHKSVGGVYSDRLIDIDLLFCFASDGTPILLDTPGLKLPHPLMLERRFVMDPLTEIAPCHDGLCEFIRKRYLQQDKCMKTIQVQYYQSPYGELILGSFEGKLCMCDWGIEKRRTVIDKRIQHTLDADYETISSEVIAKAVDRLDAYFARKRKTFDIPLLLLGTDFQKMVWKELLNIPYGKTLSYGELSRRLGNPKAVRAVAAANGANPVSIFVPCHRAIGSDHTLTGYGGGLAAKKGLLELESDSQTLGFW